MELLPSGKFASIVMSSKKSLTNLSILIDKYCGSENAIKFANACDQLDFETANRILDDTVRELSGYSSVSIALSSFADKFPQLSPALADDVSAALSESDKVKAINNYAQRISDIMDGK